MLFCRSPVGCCVITQGAARTQAFVAPKRTGESSRHFVPFRSTTFPVIIYFSHTLSLFSQMSTSQRFMQCRPAAEACTVYR